MNDDELVPPDARSLVDPLDVVQRFWISLQTGDPAGAAALLADDVVWTNTGLPTLRGARVGALLVSLDRRGVEVEAEMHHVAASGEAVLTDRTDTIRVGRFETSFAVQGTFVVRDGEIARWEDHFSWGEATAGSARGALALLRALSRAGLRRPRR